MYHIFTTFVRNIIHFIIFICKSQYKIDKKIQNKIDRKIQNKIKNISFMSETNKDWINTFCVDKQIKELNKKIIDELIDDIVIDKNKNIRIIFKYEDKYFEALDFINKHKCDIISAS